MVIDLATDIPEIPESIDSLFQDILASKKDASNSFAGTLYQKPVRCGKKGCKCNNGQLHGPYWYLKLPNGKEKYLGKTLPDDFHQIRNREIVQDDRIDSLKNKYQKITKLQRELRRLISDFVTEVENFDKEVEI